MEENRADIFMGNNEESDVPMESVALINPVGLDEPLLDQNYFDEEYADWMSPLGHLGRLTVEQVRLTNCRYCFIV